MELRKPTRNCCEVVVVGLTRKKESKFSAGTKVPAVTADTSDRVDGRSAIEVMIPGFPSLAVVRSNGSIIIRPPKIPDSPRCGRASKKLIDKLNACPGVPDTYLHLGPGDARKHADDEEG
jgi:hypothetical protein